MILLPGVQSHSFTTFLNTCIASPDIPNGFSDLGRPPHPNIYLHLLTKILKINHNPHHLQTNNITIQETHAHQHVTTLARPTPPIAGPIRNPPTRRRTHHHPRQQRRLSYPRLFQADKWAYGGIPKRRGALRCTGVPLS